MERAGEIRALSGWWLLLLFDGVWRFAGNEIKTGNPTKHGMQQPVL
jgi:hypothetical protein